MLKPLFRYFLRRTGYDIHHSSVRKPLQKLRDHHIPSGLNDGVWTIFGLVRAMKPEVCVEIGSAQGHSACHIGAALEENGKGMLYAIDPHTVTAWNDRDSEDSFPMIQRNLAAIGVSHRVELLRTTSAGAAEDWSRSIDLLFIDGDHSYEGVKNDWNLFHPFVRPGGVVLFHDTAWQIENPDAMRPDMGVPRFVDELRLAGYPVITLLEHHGVSIVQPVSGGMPLCPAL